MTLRDSRVMTTIASSKTWAGPATNLWTCYPRWAWPCSSLIIKHYRVQVGNHHQGFWSLTQVHGLDPKHRLLFLEQINQWLSVLGSHIEWRLQASRLQNTSHVCMTDLGWFQRKQNNLSRTHGGNLHQMHMNQRKSLLSSNIFFTNGTWR